MTHQVFIRDLLAYGVIGVHPHERLAPQKIIVNVTVYCDDLPSEQNDQLNDAIDYQLLSKNLISYIQSSAHKLVEKLCAELVSTALGIDHRIKSVQISVEKPDALPCASSAGVTLLKTR